MSRYVLVYQLSNIMHVDTTFIEYFNEEEEKEMHERVNELAKINENSLNVLLSGLLQVEFEYKALIIVTEYRPKIKS
jgi:formate dehydrogenase maturation protein FdhE